jgi:hypothetical protein
MSNIQIQPYQQVSYNTVSTTLNIDTGSTIIYLNFILKFTGGGNVTMGATYSYTRIG